MIDLNLTLIYALGALIVSGMTTLWFFSNLPIHIFKILRLIKTDDEVYTWDEWQMWTCARSSFFGELLSCPLCLGFWLSLAVSEFLTYMQTLTPWFIPASVLSWPVFIYFFYSKFSTEEG